MKAIATVNFKGGVGKTTITWLLAKYASEKMNKKILVMDTDAQMSLTMAISLQETGQMLRQFANWYENSYKNNQSPKTIFRALQDYDDFAAGRKKYFDFPIDYQFIYQFSNNLHFIPSIEDLYWLELDVFDRVALKDFIRALLGKIEHSKNLPTYEYVFFDCPPNFTALSYSVLSCSSLLLIPVNPDVYAPRGVELMVDGLRMRIEPWPNPKIAVFMNKARTNNTGALTSETKGYWELTKDRCIDQQRKGANIIALESPIIDRVSIKRAVPGVYFPVEFESYFSKLWYEIENFLV